MNCETKNNDAACDKTTENVDDAPPCRARVVISQVVACMALNVLLMDLGMSISFVTVVYPHISKRQDGETLFLDSYQASWFGSIAFLSQPMGSIFSGPLLDYFGRRKALLLVNIPHLIAWLLMHYCWNIPSLFVANAMLGLGTGIMEAPSVTYVGEVSDASVRGPLTTLTNVFTSGGILATYLLGSVLPWRQAALLSLTFPILTMLLVLLVPESPIWLLSKGKHNEALNSLCKLRGWAKPHHVKKEFDQLVEYNEMVHQCVACIKTGQTPKDICEHSSMGLFDRIFIKLKYIFFTEETLRPFKLVMAYFFFHTMSGLGPIRPNMMHVCAAFGMMYEPKTITIIVGVIYITMTLVAVSLVKLVGKRKLVLSSMFACSASTIGLSLYARLYLGEDVLTYVSETFPSEKSHVPLILFLLMVSFTALGIPWVLLSEMFSFRSRGTATGLAAALTYVIFFLATKTNLDVEKYFHLSGTFAMYGALGFVGTVYLYLYLPETENKTLVEIEGFYKGKRKIFADDKFINFLKGKRKSKNKKEINVLI